MVQPQRSARRAFQGFCLALFRSSKIKASSTKRTKTLPPFWGPTKTEDHRLHHPELRFLGESEEVFLLMLPPRGGLRDRAGYRATEMPLEWIRLLCRRPRSTPFSPVEVRVEEKRLDQAIEFPESPARSPSEPALDQRCPVPRMRSRRAAADLGALAACSVGVGNRPDFRILSACAFSKNGTN